MVRETLEDGTDVIRWRPSVGLGPRKAGLAKELPSRFFRPRFSREEYERASRAIDRGSHSAHDWLVIEEALDGPLCVECDHGVDEHEQNGSKGFACRAELVEEEGRRTWCATCNCARSPEEVFAANAEVLSKRAAMLRAAEAPGQQRILGS